MKKPKNSFKAYLILLGKEKQILEKQILELTNEKTMVLKKLKREKENIQVGKEELSKRGTLNSSFFMGFYGDAESIKKYETELEKIEQKIKYILIELEKLKKKEEKVWEINKKREKEFYVELNKKEESSVSELKILLDIKEDK